MGEISLLGHVITDGGIAVDPGKVKDVLDWQPPQTMSEIWSFLGLAGYYRRFIENFPKLLNLLQHFWRREKILSGQMLVRTALRN